MRAWAARNGPAKFSALSDDFPEVNATDLGSAAQAAGVLHWDDSHGGFYVGHVLE